MRLLSSDVRLPGFWAPLLGPLPRRRSVPGGSRPTFPDETMSDLRIDVADLLNHPGSRRPLHREAGVEGLGGRAGARRRARAARSRARTGARRRRRSGHGPSPLGRSMQRLSCVRSRPTSMWRSEASSSYRTPSTARPTRWPATRSTSSSSSAMRCCSNSRLPQRARLRAHHPAWRHRERRRRRR